MNITVRPSVARDAGACAVAAEALGAAPGRVDTEPFFVEPQPWTGPPPVPLAEG